MWSGCVCERSSAKGARKVLLVGSLEDGMGVQGAVQAVVLGEGEGSCCRLLRCEMMLTCGVGDCRGGGVGGECRCDNTLGAI